MLNDLTMDAEEHHHVSAFESVARFKDWDQYESRVERNQRWTNVVFGWPDNAIYLNRRSSLS